MELIEPKDGAGAVWGWSSRITTELRVTYQHQSRPCSRMLTPTVAVRKRAEEDKSESVDRITLESHVSFNLRGTNEKASSELEYA